MVQVRVTVATITSENRTHELVRDAGAYLIVTTVDGKPVSQREVTQDEAGEWVDTTKRCGGVVHDREVIR